ncbi:uncharacterized protein LOC121190938 [Toxotes jaculatrix]|uniref:uncharacterized protein LOC121190938 n=1 Tax=Toxotes jaculatrix TaxID=941984 RepID=UPI001B3A9418|nr:uncharacterized protein LOC121190938 [Toxotes jaculatrix]
MSLSLQRVPMLWKTSCLVPVPKTSRPSDLKDYRPVALTSHIMKTLERLILEQLRPMVQPFMDPLQFAYQPRLGVDDAIIYLLNSVYTHLDKPASTVRIMFFDFSSAFDTIRPTLLGEKLTVMQVDAPLVSWIVNYLTGRPQYVRLQCCGDESEYRTVVDNFVTWSKRNHLQLNVMKTKELVVNLRRTKATATPVNIQGVNVDMVEEYSPPLFLAEEG